MKQTTDHILLIKPRQFYSNPQTKINNYFQGDGVGGTMGELSDRALKEFNSFAAMLEGAGVKVTQWEADSEDTPDAIFPNNWIVTDCNSKIYLMPMFAENRRKERSARLVEHLRKEFVYKELIDFTSSEDEGLFFEGTGSAVIHRPSKSAYIALSERSDLKTAKKICFAMDLTPIFFSAYQSVKDQRKLIYHTNVVMSVGEKFVVACLDAVDDVQERQGLVRSFSDRGLELIEINESQMNDFCGNILQIEDSKGAKQIVMSERAFGAFQASQRERLESHGNILKTPLTVIESLGGGGARCMMAELFN